MRIIVIAVSALVALTACDSADERDTAVAAKAVVTCADKAQKAEVPQGFPASFPWPAHTVVIGSEQRSEKRVIVTAISSDAEKDVLSALQKDLPAAGYTLSNGEVESGDAESDWSATGWKGRWAIRAIPGCDNDTVVTVLAAPA